MTPDGKKNRGVTLVELIIAMAIVAVIIAASTATLLTGIKTYNRNFNDTVGQQNLRVAMMDISKQVRNNSGAAAVTGTGTLTVNGKNYAVSAGNLTYNGQTLAQNIASVRASYTDAGHSVIQIDLTSADGNTLSTQISLK